VKNTTKAIIVYRISFLISPRVKAGSKAPNSETSATRAHKRRAGLQGIGGGASRRQRKIITSSAAPRHASRGDTVPRKGRMKSSTMNGSGISVRFTTPLYVREAADSDNGRRRGS
jgi:hypothetical protein